MLNNQDEDTGLWYLMMNFGDIGYSSSNNDGVPALSGVNLPGLTYQQVPLKTDADWWAANTKTNIITGEGDPDTSGAFSFLFNQGNLMHGTLKALVDDIEILEFQVTDDDGPISNVQLVGQNKSWFELVELSQGEYQLKTTAAISAYDFAADTDDSIQVAIVGTDQGGLTSNYIVNVYAPDANFIPV